MLGCLVLVTAVVVVLVLGGLLVRRPAPPPIPTAGREARVATRPVDVFFTPEPGAPRVRRLEPGETIWTLPLSTGWSAVYDRPRAQLLAGFAPDSTLAAATRPHRRARRLLGVPGAAQRASEPALPPAAAADSAGRR